MMHNLVVLAGGLGNQLFQLAFGRWLERHSERETRYLVGHSPPFEELLSLGALGEHLRSRGVVRGRSAGRDIYRMWDGDDAEEGLPFPDRRVRRLASPDQPVPRAAVDPAEYDRPAVWVGYWGRPEYADALLPALTAAIESTGPSEAPQAFVGVHVRRGDMLGTTDAVPGDWFEPALRRLRESPSAAAAEMPATVWSDDLGWCRERLELTPGDGIAPPGRPLEHLAQLSRASAMVVSRSTFSWWAAAVAAGRSSRTVPVVFPAPWKPHQPAPPQPAGAPHWIPFATSSPSEGA